MGLWLLLGALNGLVAVGAGAYGWHWLAVEQSGMRDIFAIGVQYQMWHALALVAVAWLRTRAEAPRAAGLAGAAFTLGIVLFCGSVYSLALLGDVPARGLAPVGGGLLMLGWAALAWAGVAAVIRTGRPSPR